MVEKQNLYFIEHLFKGGLHFPPICCTRQNKQHETVNFSCEVFRGVFQVGQMIKNTRFEKFYVVPGLFNIQYFQLLSFLLLQVKDQLDVNTFIYLVSVYNFMLCT